MTVLLGEGVTVQAHGGAKLQIRVRLDEADCGALPI